MQIKFAICCKKIHKVGCGNSQSDGGKVNNYQPLKTISFYLFVHELNELNEVSFYLFVHEFNELNEGSFFVQNVPKWIKKIFSSAGYYPAKRTKPQLSEENLRDRRGKSDGKYAAKRNNRHQMPGKGTTSIECRGKGGDGIAD